MQNARRRLDAERHVWDDLRSTLSIFTRLIDGKKVICVGFESCPTDTGDR